MSISSVYWVRVGQGQALLAVGVGGGCLDNFLSSFVSDLSNFSLGNGLIKTEILPQKDR